MPTALEGLQALLQEMKRQVDQTNPYDPDIQCGAWSFQEGTNEAAKLWHERLQEVERAFRQERCEQEEKLQKLAVLAHREHVGCDDRWYSCPKHEEGCTDTKQGSDCNCGADALNKEIAILLTSPQ